MSRSDLAEFLEVPITAVRNWERGKSRQADSQAVLDRLTKIQENLERAYLDVDSGGEQMLWVEETGYPITVNSEEAGARLFFLHAPYAMGIRALDGARVFARTCHFALIGCSLLASRCVITRGLSTSPRIGSGGA